MILDSTRLERSDKDNPTENDHDETNREPTAWTRKVLQTEERII